MAPQLPPDAAAAAGPPAEKRDRRSTFRMTEQHWERHCAEAVQLASEMETGKGDRFVGHLDVEHGVEDLAGHVKSATEAKGSYANVVKQNPIMATYMVDREGRYCAVAMNKICAAVALGLLTASFVAGFYLLPNTFAGTKASMLAVSPESPCFGGGGCPQVKYHYYMWNLTNVDAFLGGAEPPALEEVGPYVLELEQENYEAEFLHGDTEVRPRPRRPGRPATAR